MARSSCTTPRARRCGCASERPSGITHAHASAACEAGRASLTGSGAWGHALAAFRRGASPIPRTGNAPYIQVELDIPSLNTSALQNLVQDEYVRQV
jgi:hypothetical protein